MKLTNKHDLPDPVVRAIENDPYTSGDSDFTTTQLIDPPQLIALKKRYADSLEEDVSERIWALLGQCIHVLLERAAPESVTAEKRYFVQIDGVRISGQIDLLNTTTLVDYKVTSVWTYLYKSREVEWAAQGNINHWLYVQNGGIPVKSLQNILFLRDWVQNKTENGRRYPKVQVVTIDLPLWTLDEAERFVKERVRIHKGARYTADAKLAPCSDEERWMRDGEPKRCLTYCAVRRVCNQHRNFLNGTSTASNF